MASFKPNSRNAALLEEFLRIRGEEFLKVRSCNTVFFFHILNLDFEKTVAERSQNQAVVKPGAGMTPAEQRQPGPDSQTVYRTIQS